VEPRGALARRPARREPHLRRARPRGGLSLSGLGSAPLPPIGPGDHVRGPEAARLVVVYADFECPFCAALEQRLRRLALRVAFRHFPVRSAHPRAWAAAAAAEAAAAQGAFWAMHDALFDDQGRLEDPHLWERAERLGLDVARFDADRRSPAVEARIAADFRGGVRAGVATTPTLFADGERYGGRPEPGVLERLANPG
jgi:protein-disulfide isomerase